MVHTPLYNTLLNLNNEYYKYIRASVFRYMDKPSKEYLENIIDAEEERRGIPFEQRADKDKRLPWKWIKDVAHPQHDLYADVGGLLLPFPA